MDTSKKVLGVFFALIAMLWITRAVTDVFKKDAPAPKPIPATEIEIYTYYTITRHNGEIDSLLVDSDHYQIACDYWAESNEDGHNCGIANLEDIYAFLDAVVLGRVPLLNPLKDAESVQPLPTMPSNLDLVSKAV